MTDIRELLAQNIKNYRAIRDLSQEMLAERAGTSTTHIGMIETAKKYPSPQMLAKIAGALGIDTPELFTTNTVTLLPGSGKSIELLHQEIAGDFKQFEKTVTSRIKELQPKEPQKPSPAVYPPLTDSLSQWAAEKDPKKKE